MVEGAADGGVPVLHFADVVHAHIPLVAGAMKGVGKAARLVVALEYQHPLAAVLTEQNRGRQSADAGADYDRVPLFVELCLLVWSALGCHRALACRRPHVDSDNINLALKVAAVNILLLKLICDRSPSLSPRQSPQDPA